MIPLSRREQVSRPSFPFASSTIFSALACQTERVKRRFRKFRFSRMWERMTHLRRDICRFPFLSFYIHRWYPLIDVLQRIVLKDDRRRTRKHEFPHSCLPARIDDDLCSLYVDFLPHACRGIRMRTRSMEYCCRPRSFES